MIRRIFPRYKRLDALVLMVGAGDLIQWFEQGTPEIIEDRFRPELFTVHPEGPLGWTSRTLALRRLARAEPHQGRGASSVEFPGEGVRWWRK